MKKMNKLLALLLCLTAIFTFVACNGPQTPSGDGSTPGGEATYEPTWLTDGSAARAEEWLGTVIENNQLFTFKYNGQDFASFIGSWTRDVQTSTDEANKTKSYTVTYKAPDGLEFKSDITLDTRFGLIEWCCYFNNTASSESGVISEIQPLNANLPVVGAQLTTAKGSSCKADDFEPINVDLSSRDYRTESVGGRSSSGGFPYYELRNDEGGIFGGIGWTGDWRATFYNKGDSGVNVVAGMKETKIALYANESMRTPSMMLMFYNGTQAEGHNKFRQMILDSYTPEDENGEPVQELPFFANTWGQLGEDAIMAELDLLDRLGINYEGLWIDAGWYCTTQGQDDGSWNKQVGTWDINTTMYPEGFTNIAERLKENGKELLVWFEPERAVAGSKEVQLHSNYYLPKYSSVYFYNLASDQATDYMIDKIGNMLKDNGVTWYRQDFNADPASTWANNDRLQGQNRVGMTEIKYITNLYRYLDEIVEMNPGLMIDNCASGGRRLDFEMMKRSVPLWRTDYNLIAGSTTDEIRSINYNLSWWLPLSAGGCSQEGRSSDHHWRSMQSASLVVGTAAMKDSFYLPGVDEYFDLRSYMWGDYYILSQGVGDDIDRKNAIYEYYLPEEGKGFVMAFYPENSSERSKTYKLLGLDRDATYVVSVTESGATFEASGADLMDIGLSITFKTKDSSVLIKFDKKA